MEKKPIVDLKPSRLNEAACHIGDAGRPFRLKARVSPKLQWKPGRGKVAGFELTPSHAGGFWGPYGWFEYQHEAEWFALASNTLILLKDPEQFLLDALDIIAGVATPEQLERARSQICRECRAPISRSDQTSMNAVPGQCSQCSFWAERLRERNKSTVIVDGKHYSIGSPQYAEPPRERDFLGFGGARWEIQFNDGRREVTHNLWSQGDVPERLRALPEWQDNAKFIPTALDTFKHQVAVATGFDLKHAHGTCARATSALCLGDGTATSFSDDVSAAEYEITGLCQKCQDHVFAEPEEEQDPKCKDCGGPTSSTEELCEGCGAR